MDVARPAGSVAVEPSAGPGVSVPAPRSADELHAALQPLELEPQHDATEALDAAVELELAATALGDVELAMRAQLVQSDMWDRVGEVATGARMAWDVNRWATDHDHRPLLARSHRLLATTYHNLGETATSLEHALLGVELLDDDTSPKVRALHLTTLADQLGWAGSFQAARERYDSALEIAVALGDLRLRLRVLNNLAYTEYDAGHFDRAGAVVEQLRLLSAGQGSEVVAGFMDTFARVQIGLGRFAEAEQTMRESLDIYYSGGAQEADSLAEMLLTLAEAQRLQGSLSQAQANLDQCEQVCDERNLADVQLRVLQEQAEMHAAAGHFKEAFEVHKVFHSEEQAALSRERDSQAQTRHAMFETAEARQDAHRFREQALHDQLTGLYNRRYVDEQLPVLLDPDAQGGAVPLVVALVDLDRFKRINDTFSHDVGDQVLIVVARLLAAAASSLDTGDERGFAARMGGEEFLLVLPATRPADAVRRLEELRQAVRSHDWRGLTPDLTVTVSIGAATANDRLSQAGLLARADHNLYAAKNAGRDRVIADTAPEGDPSRPQFRRSDS